MSHTFFLIDLTNMPEEVRSQVSENIRDALNYLIVKRAGEDEAYKSVREQAHQGIKLDALKADSTTWDEISVRFVDRLRMAQYISGATKFYTDKTFEEMFKTSRYPDGQAKSRDIHVRDELHEAFYEWGIFVEELHNPSDASMPVRRALTRFSEEVDRLYQNGITAISDGLSNWESYVERQTMLIRDICEHAKKHLAAHSAKGNK